MAGASYYDDDELCSQNAIREQKTLEKWRGCVSCDNVLGLVISRFSWRQNNFEFILVVTIFCWILGRFKCVSKYDRRSWSSWWNLRCLQLLFMQKVTRVSAGPTHQVIAKSSIFQVWLLFYPFLQYYIFNKERELGIFSSKLCNAVLIWSEHSWMWLVLNMHIKYFHDWSHKWENERFFGWLRAAVIGQ